MLRLTTDDEDDEYTHNECTKGTMEIEDIDEGNIVVSLKLHGVFQDGGDTLKNLINTDLVTPGRHKDQTQAAPPISTS